MSDKNFTPGPWIFDGGEMVKCSFGNSVSLVTPTNKTKDMKGCIAYPFKALPEVAGDADTQRIANCHLIAAAPEMYELLSWMFKRFDASDSEELVALGWKIEELLKKARGER